MSSCIHACVHRCTHSCANSYGSFLAMWSVCEPFRKLSGSSESARGGGRRWKRKDRRLKCRFRATLEPRKHLSLLAHITPTPSPLPSFLSSPLLLLFTFSPSSIFGIHRFSSSRHSCLSCFYHSPASRSPCLSIYLALRLTLGLLEYRAKGYPSVTDCLDFTE